ncbi:hypothetical protein [Haliangium sp.]|uniref:hypothetical protein n=1 Tax=Haliangium sp. TaxID=2663208 RepID=UPI003D0CB05B
MDRIGRIISWMTLSVALTACGSEGGGDTVDAQPVVPDAFIPIPSSPTPATISDSGLFVDVAGEVLAPGVRPFEPAYALWTDGAEKHRWIYLPPESTIDTSNMDRWVLPVGTKVWKEFRRNGVRVETRLLSKTGPNEWWTRAYVWNDTQNDAVVAPNGVGDVLGTGHEIPPTQACMDCHGNVSDMAVGFSAVLLDHDGPGVTLDDLVAEGRLSHPPARNGDSYFTLPGSRTDRDALGYLHANCSTCHNPDSMVYQYGDAVMDFRLYTDGLGSLESTAAFKTAVCGEIRQQLAGAEQIIVPGDPTTSAVFMRMNLRGNGDQMPKIGSDIIDDLGVEIMWLWINSLSACPQ